MPAQIKIGVARSLVMSLRQHALEVYGSSSISNLKTRRLLPNHIFKYTFSLRRYNHILERVLNFLSYSLANSILRSFYGRDRKSFLISCLLVGWLAITGY